MEKKPSAHLVTPVTRKSPVALRYIQVKDYLILHTLEPELTLKFSAHVIWNTKVHQKSRVWTRSGWIQVNISKFGFL